MATPELFTAREVAPRIRRHYQTVLRYAREGKIRATNPTGGGYLFDQAAIDEFLSGGKVTAPEPVPSKPSRNPKYARSSK